MKNFNDYIKLYKNSKVVDEFPISHSSDIITGNPHLWNGQYALLCWLLKHKFDAVGFNQYHEYCQLKSGLFSRFDEELYKTRKFDAISFDEMNGISFSNVDLARAICKYGEDNSWVYNEIPPYEKPSFTVKDYLAVPKTLFNIIKTAIATKKLGGSNQIDQIIFESKILTFYSRMMLPKNSFVWKACALIEPSFLETLHFCLNVLNTIKSEKTSGKNMHVFIFIALHLKKSPLLDNYMVKRVMKKFLKEVDHKANAIKFYPENHPFIEAIDQAVEILKKEYL